MRACVRLDNRVGSVRFAVEHGLCQESVLAPLLFNVLFASFRNVACTRFEAEKNIMDADHSYIYYMYICCSTDFTCLYE